MKDGSGFEWADLIQVWIAVAVSLSAFFALLLWRVTRIRTFQTMPNVKAHGLGGNPPRLAFIALEGPTADRWVISRATITQPRDVVFLHLAVEPDDYGGGSWSIGEPVGRVLDYPSSTIVLSSLDKPVSINVRLSLKAFPKIANLQPITIIKND